MKKIFVIILALVIMCATLCGCGYNKQIIDLDYKYDTAIVYFPTEEIKTFEIKSWNDFENSDAVQIITTDGEVIYTHFANVLLCGKR